MHDGLTGGFVVVDIRDHVAQVVQVLGVLVGLGHRALGLAVGGLGDFVGGGQLLLIFVDNLIRLVDVGDLRGIARLRTLVDLIDLLVHRLDALLDVILGRATGDEQRTYGKSDCCGQYCLTHFAVSPYDFQFWVP